jgi:hypothetical protein
LLTFTQVGVFGEKPRDAYARITSSVAKFFKLVTAANSSQVGPSCDAAAVSIELTRKKSCVHAHAHALVTGLVGTQSAFSQLWARCSPGARAPHFKLVGGREFIQQPINKRLEECRAVARYVTKGFHPTKGASPDQITFVAELTLELKGLPLVHYFGAARKARSIRSATKKSNKAAPITVPRAAAVHGPLHKTSEPSTQARLHDFRAMMIARGMLDTKPGKHSILRGPPGGIAQTRPSLPEPADTAAD